MKKTKALVSTKPQTLGALIRAQLMADPKKQAALSKNGGGVVFAMLGDTINAWLAGETKMVVMGKAKLTGEVETTYKKCGKKAGFTVDALAGKREGDVALLLSVTVADLAYLLLRGLVAPQKVDYTAPSEKNAVSILNLSELLERYPDLSKDLPILAKAGRLDPGSVRCPAAIAAVDAGVLILDYVRASR